jgi:hypothetical protein
MAWQLIYTSAPRGLTTGRSGFCTVARHRSLRERLAADLERFSAYDRSGETPETLHSHRILAAGRETFHVLTRIMAAGVDYTGRGNHLAHHLIFTPSETASLPSPAAILRAWKGWLERYEEAPRFLEDAEQPDLSGLGSKAGSSPAAAFLASERGRKGVVLLQPSGALETFEQALAVISRNGAATAWQIPFTTWLQASDLEDWPAWSATAPGSPLAEKARTSGRIVFDPARPEAPLPDDAPAARPPAPAEKIAAPARAAVQKEAAREAAPAEEPPRRAALGIRPLHAALILVALAAIIGSAFLYLHRHESARALPAELARLEAAGDAEGLARLVETAGAQHAGSPELDHARQWLQEQAWIDRVSKARNLRDLSLVRDLVNQAQSTPALDFTSPANKRLPLALEDAGAWVARQEKETRETIGLTLKEFERSGTVPGPEDLRQLREAVAQLPPVERPFLLERIRTLASAAPTAAPAPDPAVPAAAETHPLASLLGARTTWIGIADEERAVSWPAALPLCALVVPKPSETLKVELIGSALLPPQAPSIVLSARPPKPGDPWRFYDRLNLLLELQTGPENWQLRPGKDFDKAKLDPAAGFILRSMTGTFQLVVPGADPAAAALARLPGSILSKNADASAWTLPAPLDAAAALFSTDPEAAVTLEPRGDGAEGGVAVPMKDATWPGALSAPAASPGADLVLQTKGRTLPVITFDPDYQLPEETVSPL